MPAADWARGLCFREVSECPDCHSFISLAMSDHVAYCNVHLFVERRHMLMLHRPQARHFISFLLISLTYSLTPFSKRRTEPLSTRYTYEASQLLSFFLDVRFRLRS